MRNYSDQAKHVSQSPRLPNEILRGCMVLSTNGTRPARNKLFGADYDGDEGVAIWDHNFVWASTAAARGLSSLAQHNIATHCCICYILLPQLSRCARVFKSPRHQGYGEATSNVWLLHHRSGNRIVTPHRHHPPPPAITTVVQRPAVCLTF